MKKDACNVADATECYSYRHPPQKQIVNERAADPAFASDGNPKVWHLFNSFHQKLLRLCHPETNLDQLWCTGVAWTMPSASGAAGVAHISGFVGPERGRRYFKGTILEEMNIHLPAILMPQVFYHVLPDGQKTSQTALSAVIGVAHN